MSHSEFRKYPIDLFSTKFIDQFIYAGEQHYVGYFIEHSKSDFITRPAIFKAVSANYFIGDSGKADACNYNITPLDASSLIRLTQKFELD